VKPFRVFGGGGTVNLEAIQQTLHLLQKLIPKDNDVSNKMPEHGHTDLTSAQIGAYQRYRFAADARELELLKGEAELADQEGNK
jgi:hypothetical protein